MKEYAAKNDNAFLNQRLIKEESEEGGYIRDSFQRDRDRILHSRAFRRLMHKTQIFNANTGDHYRNRLTHTLEVSQIARSIGKYLQLNEELIEAIALGHDLGHTPFGHIGEYTLNLILNNKFIESAVSVNQGFKHNFQSLRLVDDLENKTEKHRGLNLTLAVREGILKHTSLKEENGDIVFYPDMNLTNINLETPSFSLEGQVVAIADEIAQCTHDLEDSVRSKIITLNEIKKVPIIERIVADKRINFDIDATSPAYTVRTQIIHDLIGLFIHDVCEHSASLIESYCQRFHPQMKDKYDCFNEICISSSKDITLRRKELYELIINKVICSETISAADAKSEYIIKKIFMAYYMHPKQLPDYVLIKYATLKGVEFNRMHLKEADLRKDDLFIRIVCDHISGMTDQFASREFNRLYLPDFT